MNRGDLSFETRTVHYTIVTVTKPSKIRCSWCGVSFKATGGAGRPRRYCRRSHRQRHYESRVLADQRGLSPGELLVDRASVDRLHDLLYVLETVCEDARADLRSEAGDVKEYQRIIDRMLEAAEDLRDAYLEPKADPLG